MDRGVMDKVGMAAADPDLDPVEGAALVTNRCRLYIARRLNLIIRNGRAAKEKKGESCCVSSSISKDAVKSCK